ERSPGGGGASPARVRDGLADGWPVLAVLRHAFEGEATQPVFVDVRAALAVGQRDRAGSVVGELVPVHAAVVAALGVAGGAGEVVGLSAADNDPAKTAEVVPGLLVLRRE